MRFPKLTDSRWHEPFMPSFSANYNNSRGNLGVVGDLLHGHTFAEVPDYRPQELLRSELGEPELVSGNELAVALRTHEVPFPEELFSFSSTVGPLLEGQVRTVVNTRRFREHWSGFFDLLERYADREIPLVKVICLSESLKVRPITKGPPCIYTVLKRVQKALHGHMRNFPVFEFIGKEINAEDLFARVGPLREGEVYHSADFSDATNQIRSWASECAVDEVSRALGLTESQIAMFHKAMTQHIIEVGEGKRADFLEQQSGQLMGSIVSFPILCLVNAAVVRWALELATNSTIPLRDARMSINGDDALFPIPRAGIRLWEVISSYAGLFPSIGKVYSSSKFANMNSTLYLYHPPRDDQPGRFEWVKYVNFGLISGAQRSSLKVQKSDMRELPKAYECAARHNELYASVPEACWPRTHDLFMEEATPLLQRVARPLPWGVPQALGGLGLVARREEPLMGPLPEHLVHLHGVNVFRYGVEVSDLDRRAISYIMRNMGQCRPRLIRPENAKICVRQSVEKRYRMPTVWVRDDDPRAEVSARLENLLCVAELFRAPVVLDTVDDHTSVYRCPVRGTHQVRASNASSQEAIQAAWAIAERRDKEQGTVASVNDAAIKHNVRVWRKATREASRNQPASWNAIFGHNPEIEIWDIEDFEMEEEVHDLLRLDAGLFDH
jgi:hypothetical protein